MAMDIERRRRTVDVRASELGAGLLAELGEAPRTLGWTVATLARKSRCEIGDVIRLEDGTGSMETLVAVMAQLRFQFAGISRGDTLGLQLANRRRNKKLTIAKAAERTGLTETAVEGLEDEIGSTADLFRLLAVIAPRVRRAAPERAYWSKANKVLRDSRFTDPAFMEKIYEVFGPIGLDPCGHRMSPVIAERRVILSEGGDGLVDEWSGHLVFVNPPFSDQLPWLKRAHAEWILGNVETVIFLAPVRPDNRFFHETLRHVADFYILKGRLRFADPEGVRRSTPFALWVVMLGASEEQKARFAELVPGCWMRVSDRAR